MRRRRERIRPIEVSVRPTTTFRGAGSSEGYDVEVGPPILTYSSSIDEPCMSVCTDTVTYNPPPPPSSSSSTTTTGTAVTANTASPQVEGEFVFTCSGTNFKDNNNNESDNNSYEIDDTGNNSNIIHESDGIGGKTIHKRDESSGNAVISDNVEGSKSERVVGDRGLRLDLGRTTVDDNGRVTEGAGGTVVFNAKVFPRIVADIDTPETIMNFSMGSLIGDISVETSTFNTIATNTNRYTSQSVGTSPPRFK